MILLAQIKFGPYQILTALGAGGMGRMIFDFRISILDWQ